MVLNNEGDLIRAAVAGDREALGQLLFRHYTTLNHHISINMCKRLKSHHDPEDVLQQTFVEVVRSIGGFRIDQSASFLTWMKSIANNRIRDAARTKRVPIGADWLDEDDSEDGVLNLITGLRASLKSPSSNFARLEAARFLHDALARLDSPEEREVLRLRYLEERELEEIAMLMGRTRGGVRGLIHRAKLRLREAIGHRSSWLTS